MVKRYTPSQIRSKLRQAQQKQKEAIRKYNQGVRRYNQKVKSVVNKYNQEVRSHNARVRAHRQRVNAEIARLRQQSHRTYTTQFVTYRQSVEALHKMYSQLEAHAETDRLDSRYNSLLDLSEREAANSLEVANLLSGEEIVDNRQEVHDDSPELHEALENISGDLFERWKGAVFSLNPDNPDAARHFCASAREVITQILEAYAPDEDVFSYSPDCETTQRGNATRRAKIRFLLHKGNVGDEKLEHFVEEDMENIVQLFRVFNDGTHGHAGRFQMTELRAIRRRVEDGIGFLTTLGRRAE